MLLNSLTGKDEVNSIIKNCKVYLHGINKNFKINLVISSCSPTLDLESGKIHQLRWANGMMHVTMYVNGNWYSGYDWSWEKVRVHWQEKAINDAKSISEWPCSTADLLCHVPFRHLSTFENMFIFASLQVVIPHFWCILELILFHWVILIVHISKSRPNDRRFTVQWRSKSKIWSTQ